MSKEFILKEVGASRKRIRMLQSITTLMLALVIAVALILFFFGLVNLEPFYIVVGLFFLLNSPFVYLLVMAICDATINLTYIREDSYQLKTAVLAQGELDLISKVELI